MFFPGFALTKQKLHRIPNNVFVVFPIRDTRRLCRRKATKEECILSRIDTISNAMELREFGKNKKRTWYMQRPFQKADIGALILGALLLAMSLTVTLSCGRFYNPFQ